MAATLGFAQEVLDAIEEEDAEEAEREEEEEEKEEAARRARHEASGGAGAAGAGGASGGGGGGGGGGKTSGDAAGAGRGGGGEGGGGEGGGAADRLYVTREQASGGAPPPPQQGAAAPQRDSIFKNVGPPWWPAIMTPTLRYERLLVARKERELVGMPVLAKTAKAVFRIGAALGSSGFDSPFIGPGDVPAEERASFVEELMKDLPHWWAEIHGNGSTRFYREEPQAARMALNTMSSATLKALQAVYATTEFSRNWLAAMKALLQTGIKPESATDMKGAISANPDHVSCGLAGGVYAVYVLLTLGDLKAVCKHDVSDEPRACCAANMRHAANHRQHNFAHTHPLCPLPPSHPIFQTVRAPAGQEQRRGLLAHRGAAGCQ
jgi:hypothetical protein